MRSRWHPETLWCALKGHAAPAATVRNITDADALIALPLSESSHVARCLRCDAWVISPPSLRTSEELPSLAQLELPQRGKDLRDAIVLKVISVDRALHCVLFTMAFIGLLLVETHLGGLQSTARRLVDNSQNTLASSGQELSRGFVNRELTRFISLNKNSVQLLLVTTGIYALVEGVEAVGLWMQKRWAEYLTAIATAGFLPFEIDELSKRVSVLRVSALVINLAVLIYLVWAKRLFGVRGGAADDKAALKAAEQIKPLPGQPIPASD